MSREPLEFKKFLRRQGGLIGDEECMLDYEDNQILIVGAGGLGCEILKTLAMSGFRKLSIIDLDDIDYSNLNRQFLFRKKDVGRPKSVVAAEFVKKRVPECEIEAIQGRVECQPIEFFRKFQYVINGLDNIEARQNVNKILHSFVKFDENGELDPTTVIPLIDGGTEGFGGQLFVITPGLSACFDCRLETFGETGKVPLCTIASQPRIPEHCVAWAVQLAWGDPQINTQFPPGTKLDADIPEHVQWCYEKAVERGKEKGIEGITLRLTLGTMKNIIPAIASTNSLIAAQSSCEALKSLTASGANIDNAMFYSCANGICTTVQCMEKKDGRYGESKCCTCSEGKIELHMNETNTLQDIVDHLQNDPNLQLKSPVIGFASGQLIYVSSGRLKEQYAANLTKTLKELEIENEEQLVVNPNIHLLDKIDPFLCIVYLE